MGSTFGATLSGTSSATLVMDVSADGEAFTGAFADFQVEVNNVAGASAPMAARWEGLVLPLADTPHGDSITVSVSEALIGINGGLSGARHLTLEPLPVNVPPAFELHS